MNNLLDYFKIHPPEVCIFFTKLFYYKRDIQLNFAKQVYLFIDEELILLNISLFVVTVIIYPNVITSFYKRIDRIIIVHIFILKQIVDKARLINFH